MGDNLSDVLNNLMNNSGKQKLQNSMPALITLLSSPEGRLLYEKIKSADKNKLAKMLAEINSGEVNEKLDKSEDVLKNAMEDKEFIKKLINALS